MEGKGIVMTTGADGIGGPGDQFLFLGRKQAQLGIGSGWGIFSQPMEK